MPLGPYKPSLKKLADCMCQAPKDQIESYHGWAMKAGIDKDTVKRYAVFHLFELNKKLAKCGRKAVDACALPGLKSDPPQTDVFDFIVGLAELGSNAIQDFNSTMHELDETFRKIDRTLRESR